MISTLEQRALLAAPIIQITFGQGPIGLSTYHDQPYSTTEFSLVSGWDPDETSVQLVVGDDPTHGTVTMGGGNVTYTPDAGYVGNDSFTLKYVDGDGEESDEVDVQMQVTNSGPYLTALTDFYTPLVAQFSGAHDQVIVQSDSWLMITDEESDSPTLSIIDDVTNGTLDFVATTGAFTYMPDPLFVGQDSFTFTASDGLTNGASGQTITVMLNITNSPPNLASDEFMSRGGAILRVPISELLSNDTDIDDSIDLATFQLGPTGNLRVERDGDVLVITPQMPNIGDPPRLEEFTYQITDGPGAVGVGTVGIITVPGTLKEMWMATLDREAARHAGYRYFGAMGLDGFFATLRSNADTADYVLGAAGSGDAVYSPFSNTVTIPAGTTSLRTDTVIHESVHIVDDNNGWYLSDSGVTLFIDQAERLGWAAQELISSNALSTLRSFEDAILDGNPHPVSEVGTRWDRVVQAWDDLPNSTYTVVFGNPNVVQIPVTNAIGEFGWLDLFQKFGIANLGNVATAYEAAIPGWPWYYHLSQFDTTTTYMVPTMLW
ncbi:MAG: Ig-like domain-containing protein [Planctomycetaceae bacterium]|nr:Ig-like domain-containing protein [Planctomycetaceae bacterium]